MNWQLVARPLNRASQLDMRGNPDSGGVWAPCLSYADGLFWLVYTDVKRLDGSFKDSHNYIVTCDSIDGNWSDPTYVNSSGFDPSLFHDSDGRKWFVNPRWNHRGPGTGGNPSHASFDGILLQEWSPSTGLIGTPKKIFDGSPRGLTEAPHLFFRNGWYYLTTAEGGTGYKHAVSLARARQIDGAYELHPEHHVLCTEGTPEHPIQRTGHGQYVEAPEGTPYHTFLMGRPLPGRFCPMGRETGIERCVWRDDWLYLETGSLLPREDVPSVEGAALQVSAVAETRFTGATLPEEFQWLRTPLPERLFRLEDGALVLTGRESIGSWFEQALVARRQEHHNYRAETRVAFDPDTYQQAAGLTTYYNRFKFHAVVVCHEPGLGRCLSILSCPGDYPDGQVSVLPKEPVPLDAETVELAVRFGAPARDFTGEQTAPGTPLGQNSTRVSFQMKAAAANMPLSRAHLSAW